MFRGWGSKGGLDLGIHREHEEFDLKRENWVFYN